ncbi:hypothetical protein SMA5143A_7939 [Streptomyces sp. MA5143a]|nr:hypothetical protein SMA5143A_7939 [Streptomyces sp. MA5143a]
MDGTCWDAADSEADEAAFGRPGNGRGTGGRAYPHVRLQDGDGPLETPVPATGPYGGNSCYHAGMAKTQLGARVDEDIAELAKKRAADLGVSVGDYLARLVQDDASGLRARAVGAAARFLADHQAVFDEAEQAQQASRGAHAA